MIKKNLLVLLLVRDCCCTSAASEGRSPGHDMCFCHAMGLRRVVMKFRNSDHATSSKQIYKNLIKSNQTKTDICLCLKKTRRKKRCDFLDFLISSCLLLAFPETRIPWSWASTGCAPKLLVFLEVSLGPKHPKPIQNHELLEVKCGEFCGERFFFSEKVVSEFVNGCSMWMAGSKEDGGIWLAKIFGQVELLDPWYLGHVLEQIPLSWRLWNIGSSLTYRLTYLNLIICFFLEAHRVSRRGL